MARKGNRKKGVSGSEPVLPKVVSEEETLNGNTSSELLSQSVKKTHHVGSDKKRKQKSRKPQMKEEHDTDAIGVEDPPLSCDTNAADYSKSTEEDLNSEQDNDIHVHSIHSPKDAKSRIGQSLNGLHMDGAAEPLEFSGGMIVEQLRSIVLSISEESRKSLERLTPLLITLSTKMRDAVGYVRRKIEVAYPIVFRWILHFGKIMLLLFMVWLDCALRGFESFLRMGTTSFFSVIWCGVLSIIAMIGMFKFLLFLAMAAVIGLFIGFTVALLLIAISGVFLLWFYGSFWTTALIVFLGGLAFLLSRERLALFIMTVYSVYCAWAYVGWLGVVFALNLSFISSDALIYSVSNNMNETRRPNRRPEQTSGMRGQPGFFSGEPMRASSAETGGGLSGDRNSGVPSTSGSESEMTSEDEVTRLLNCTDHYSALGLSRFENVDVSILKREYKKKAMLVHPDKNMGNEKAVEAFKKLQNAYEVLLDSFKRKAYDDDLRREELLNYIRRFQNASQKSRRHGLFSSAFARTEADDEDIPGESRRIACRKCGNFHIWVYTKKSKSKARWCQECKDYHTAKDGDGWVEQSSHPFFFGIMQKVDAPAAFICADSRIYDATEWYICQGMRCAVNTHKPSFHINTNVTSKHNNGKGTSSGQRGGTPMPNMEETMTEEEFFEWFQNAVQSGMFENFAGSTSESPSAQAGNTPKSSGSNSASGNSKRKKKGKKQ